METYSKRIDEAAIGLDRAVTEFVYHTKKMREVKHGTEGALSALGSSIESLEIWAKEAERHYSDIRDILVDSGIRYPEDK